MAVAVLAVTGVVFAATQGSLFSIWVDTEGKTDEQVEDEIRDQLADDGVEDPEVRFDRHGNSSRLEIEGSRGGEEFHVVRKRVGGHGHDDKVIQMEAPRIDTEREPGMTDDELEAKIRAQLEELGLDGHVKVKGDNVEVRVKKKIEKCTDGPCPPGDGDDDDDGDGDDDDDE